jgi:hypothetical protein
MLSQVCLRMDVYINCIIVLFLNMMSSSDKKRDINRTNVLGCGRSTCGRTFLVPASTLLPSTPGFRASVGSAFCLPIHSYPSDHTRWPAHSSSPGSYPLPSCNRGWDAMFLSERIVHSDVSQFASILV